MGERLTRVAEKMSELLDKVNVLDRCLNIVGRAFAKYDDMYACIVNIIHAKIMLCNLCLF